MSVSIPCKCGSGLSSARCCALDERALPASSAVKHLVPLAERATQAYRLGHKDAAAGLCRDILELAPDHPVALRTLYRVFLETGRCEAADALLARHVRLHPNAPDLTCDLARRLLQKGDLAQAETHARNAVRTAPRAPAAHNILAMVLTETNRHAAGEHHYRLVLALSASRDPVVLANLAWNLKLQGRMEEARALYVESTDGAPKIVQSWLGWARLEEADRQFDQAASKLDRAAALAPGHAGVRLARAVLHGRMKQFRQALAVLDGMPEQDGDMPSAALEAAEIEPKQDQASARLGPNEWLEKGRLLDKLGRYDEAFAAFAEGKRMAREATGQGYHRAQAQDLARRLKHFFQAPRLEFTPRAAVRTDMPQPIFVLGFPRSGTTLMEQTLSAHPRIAAGDELPTISNIAQWMPSLLRAPLPYPEALAELWMGDHVDALDGLRDLYLQQARRLGVMQDGAAWFTDKMPLNETHLGLIALLFPSAPLLHVVRHPLDVVLSVFSNHLTHGFRCAFALESIARHYLLVNELVEQYRAQMALRYLQLRYEDMVLDQEATVRRALAFIGEAFDSACLRFEENRRYARTASYAQVSEKLYRGSCFRYRNYRRHLEPVVEMLQPAIERLGYRVAWEEEREPVAA